MANEIDDVDLVGDPELEDEIKDAENNDDKTPTDDNGEANQ